MNLYQQKRKEFSSDILALLYIACETLVKLTMVNIYRLFGISKEAVTLHHAEAYLVTTTASLIVLVFLAQFWAPLGWIILVFGNLRILQIICLNVLTIFFDYSPATSVERIKRARWHFVAIMFSAFDAIVIFAFMYQFFNNHLGILNHHSACFLDYFYYSLTTFATIGYGDIHPITPFGRILACYQILTSLLFIAFFVSGVIDRFQRPHT